MARLLTILGLLAAVALSTTTTVSATSYDDLCDLMITHAQHAARAHNAKKFDDVEAYQKKVEEVFAQAVAVDPTEPQAYLNMATFQSNSHQYEESIANYDKVLAIFESEGADGGGNQEMKYRVEQARKIAQYKKFSKLRDLAYENGEGNTTLAHFYATEQLKYSPEPHRTNHQLATLEAMLCEYNKTMCEQSHYHFRIASFSTFQHVTRFLSEQMDRSAKMKCFHSKLQLGMWGSKESDDNGGGGLAAGIDDNNKKKNVLHPFMAPYLNNTREDLSADGSGIYVNTLRGVYDILGEDGIVLGNPKYSNGDCNVLVQNGDFYVNLADNLFPNPQNSQQGPVPLRSPPSSRVAADTKVLSLVQFASNTFYHWMAEVLPKLIYFRQTHPDAEFYKILIPAKGTDLTKKSALPSFVRTTLQMFNIDLAKDVIPYSSRTGITVDSRTLENGGKDGELVAVTWDPAPCPGEEFSADVTKRRMCASLSPPTALQVARRAISSVARAHATKAIPEGIYVVVVSRGKGIASRGLNTTRVAELLREQAAQRIALIDRRPNDDSVGVPQAPLAPAKKRYGDDGLLLRDDSTHGISVIEFDSDEHTLADGLNLFRGASLVVGPHGGALSNLMACEVGKTAVLEIGLSTVAAQHYKHMAHSLGLRYRRLVSGPDRLRRALNAPSLIARADAIVNNAIEVLLAQLGSDVAFRKTQIPKGPQTGAGAGAEPFNAGREADNNNGKTDVELDLTSSTGYTAPGSDEDRYMSPDEEEEEYEEDPEDEL